MTTMIAAPEALAEVAYAYDTMPFATLDATQSFNGQAIANQLIAQEVTRSLEFLGDHRRIGHFVTDGTLTTTLQSRLFHASEIGDDDASGYVVKVQAFDYSRTVDPSVPDEIAILSRLPEEPNIPTVVASGTIAIAEDPQEHWYIVMPEAERGTLADRLPVESPEQAQHVLGLVVGAVRAAIHGHQAGYVHNDIKPKNILDTGQAGQLTDWGSAVSLDGSSTPHKPITPAYTAPEVVSETVAPSPASDVYSLGATLVAALSEHALPARLRLEPILVQPSKHFAPAVVEIAEACIDTPPNRPTPPQLLVALSAQLNLRQNASHQT
jgi:serine/threonine protein kinase